MTISRLSESSAVRRAAWVCATVCRRLACSASRRKAEDDLSCTARVRSCRARLVRRTAENTAYLPMVGRKSFWTVLVDPVSAEVLGFIPLDSF